MSALKIVAVLVSAGCALGGFAQSFDAVSYVLPRMGTDNTHALSSGNVYPDISRPWGMNSWTPQTGEMGNGWVYNYADRKIRGFKQTHQPSPWINDYGQFAVMPVVGKRVFNQNDRASWFSHKAEEASPNYYRVYLADYDTMVELTPTERAAMFRVTYPDTDAPYFVVDAFDKGSYVKLLPQDRRIVGWSSRNSGGVPFGFKNFFVLEFDAPFEEAKIWMGNEIKDGVQELKDNHVGAIVKFAAKKKGDRVHVRVASSFISEEQAIRNLGELGKEDFDTVCKKGQTVWNEMLGRISVEGGSIDQLRVFYTCLYRALLFPRRLFEFNEKGEVVHYSPHDGRVYPGPYFADTGFWDTFRSLFPLLNFLYPEMNVQMTAGLENCYRESGWLPEWASPGHRGCMVGNNSASVVADAWLSGARGKGAYDIYKLYEGLLHGSENSNPFIQSVGRAGVSDYLEKGYVARETVRESVARTLEYAYDDWCIWRLAVELKRPQAEIDTYAKRCQNYRNLFDPQRKLMVGRSKDGTFNPKFNKYTWGGDFTEGNSLHYTWSVFHDIQGLIDLFGGNEQFVAQLDAVFSDPPVFDESGYGGVIHEIREMQIMNFGQYAHGNQPIQHMIYLYNYAGQPWKSQYWAREVMNRLYRPTFDGYCGDEDNGQTSAWYVWSALGFYPVCPGSGEYVLGAPLFKRAVVAVPGGKKLTINAPLNSDANRYIQSVKFNGTEYGRNFYRAAELKQGGTIEVEMGSEPNTKRGTGPEAAPYSFSRK